MNMKVLSHLQNFNIDPKFYYYYLAVVILLSFLLDMVKHHPPQLGVPMSPEEHPGLSFLTA
jgi:hypothetical protein